MQRLFRQQFGDNKENFSVDDYSRLVSLLQAELPRATTQMFAQPRISDDSINWLSDQGGQPHPLNSLPPAEGQAAQALLQERQQGISELAERLASRGAPQQEIAWLYALAEPPPEENVFVLNGQPVIVDWPSSASIDESVLAKASSAIGSSTAASAASAAGNDGGGNEPPLPPSTGGRGRRWWLWLLLLLLLLAALWWLWKSDWLDQMLNRWFGPDPVQLLKEQLRAADGNCSEMERILREHPLLTTSPAMEQQTLPEPKPELDEEQQARLVQVATHWLRQTRECYLTELAALQQKIAQTEECPALEQILADAELLKRSEAEFVAARSALEKRIRDCYADRLLEELAALQRRIDQTEPCHELEQILNQAQILKRSEPDVVAVRTALEEKIQRCHVDRLLAELQKADRDCEAMKALVEREPAIKTPQRYFNSPRVISSPAYKAMTDLFGENVEYCLAQQKEQLARELEQMLDGISDCDELKAAADDSVLLKQSDPLFVAIREKVEKRLAACFEDRRKQLVAKTVQDLNQQLEANKDDCAKLQQMAENEALWSLNAPEVRHLRAQLPQKMEKCKTQQIENAKNLCPGERPPELAPEFVLAFDGSGSMAYSINVTNQQLKQMGAAELGAALINIFLGVNMKSMPSHIYNEPTRMTVAKKAAESVVSTLPSDINAGLVVFDDCPHARSEGYYTPSQRGRLIGRINGLAPHRGTSLASGLANAGQMVDGVEREAVILLISDGEESCDMDPCAVAQQLKRAKPRVKVNVVDIMGVGAANCIARITGGRVYTAKNAAEVAQMTKKAAAEALGPERCQGR